MPPCIIGTAMKFVRREAWRSAIASPGIIEEANHVERAWGQ